MKQCLIVDDSDVIRKVARRIMTNLGYEVIEAENGQQALELCASGMPDVILLDWLMPVMGGMEFLQMFRGVAKRKRPYILYCATENDNVELSRAITSGANDVILKPYTRESLEARLAEAGLAAA